MKTPCQNNADLANLIVSNLLLGGVKTFCIGSGSRSTPFAKALQNTPSADTIVHYDERSLGFFAMGVSKAKSCPVCIITTSGSAVANLFPAVMESYMDGVPLIIITADRPFENNDCGENQTCYQTNIFGGYVKHSKTLPQTPHQFAAKSISSKLAYLLKETISSCLPVHLNVPFKEPLIEQASEIQEQSKMPKYLPMKKTLTEDAIAYVTDILTTHKKGVIVVGGSNTKESAEDIVRLSERLGFPVLADPLSGVRERGTSSVVISHYNQIIHHTGKLDVITPDLILFLGGHVISKNILLWARSCKDATQIVVTDKERHIDTTHEMNIGIDVDAGEFAKVMIENTPRKEPSLYLSLWQGYSLTIEKGIEDFFDDKDTAYEPTAALGLLPLLKDNPFPLFFGNSLPIRYADNFLFPKKISEKIFGNRGVSGIDGNLSTALGICHGLNSPLVAVVGDVTFLHDTNVLHFISEKKIPLIIVVINNNGGGIFNFLPYKEDKEFVDTMVSTPTNLDLGNIASSYDLPYWKATMKSDYEKMIAHLLEEKSSGIIEIPSDREENVSLHKRLDAFIKKALDKSIKKERTSYFSLPVGKKKKLSFASTDS